MGQYDVGLVCLNGHEINSLAASNSGSNQAFCTTCGERTTDRCLSCNGPIRGHYHVEGVISLFPWVVPSHCHACGQPYPWTQRRSEALAEALDELDELSAEEREKLKKSIPDILVETPKSGTAALRFKKAVVKVSTAGGKVLTEILTKVAAEAVKKVLGF